MHSRISLTYKKLSKTLSKKAYTKRQLGYDYYEHLFCQYRKKDAYWQIIQQLESFCSRPSQVDIKLCESFNTFEVSPKDVIKKYGKPNFKIAKKEMYSKTCIMLYRIHLGKHKAKLELHFFKEKLAFYNYRFSYLKNKDIKELHKVIKEKYIDSADVDLKNYCITDSHHNVLQLLHEGDLEIRYISTNNQLFKSIKKDIKEQAREASIIERKHIKSLKKHL